jgi:hypothetical protein
MSTVAKPSEVHVHVRACVRACAGAHDPSMVQEAEMRGVVF